MTTLVAKNQNENENENQKRRLAQFSYLTIVPRGLQCEIASGLREQADALVALALDDAVGDNGGTSSNVLAEDTGTIDIDDENAGLKVTTWNQDKDGETMQEALRDFSAHQKEKQQRQRQNERQQQRQNQRQHQQLNKTQLEEHVSAAWLPPGSFVGSVKLSSSGQHVSIGYSRPSSFALPSALLPLPLPLPSALLPLPSNPSTRDSPPQSVPSWTCTGQMAGSVWMQLETNHKGISRDVIASSRSIGPLLALISVQTDNRCLEGTPRAPQSATAATTTNSISNNNSNNANDANDANDANTTNETAADQANGRKDQQPQDHDFDYYQRYHQHSLEEMTAELVRHLRSDPTTFSGQRDRAMRLWKDCVASEWKDRLSPSDYRGLQQRIHENRLRFRLSCVRVEPFVAPSPSSRKRKTKFRASMTTDRFGFGFAYSRKEFCRAVMNACGRDLVPEFRQQPQQSQQSQSQPQQQQQHDDNDNDNDEKTSAGCWTVDLTDFDLELVVFLLPPNNPRSGSGVDGNTDGNTGTCTGKLAIGISLRPYSFLRSKSFETGQLPPDVTAPYLGGGMLSQDVLRLRPTTAHLLLEMADLQPWDVVLDPCAGIGTIPLEAERYRYRHQYQCQYQYRHQCQFQCQCQCHSGLEPPTREGPGGKDRYLAIGGDLVLNNPRFAKIAGLLETMGGSGVDDDNSNSRRNSSSMLVAWDAAHLPLRTSSVDVAVSDLPFGQQCMSINSLQQLLPLIFLECARVLRPRTGRMVVLAGGSPIGLIACIEKLSGDCWEKPIPRVSPVSIGGILAWIVVVVRNDKVFDRSSSVPEQRTLVRKIVAKRDRINRQRQSDSCEQQTGGRRRKKGDAPADYV